MARWSATANHLAGRVCIPGEKGAPTPPRRTGWGGGKKTFLLTGRTRSRSVVRITVSLDWLRPLALLWRTTLMRPLALAALALLIATQACAAPKPPPTPAEVKKAEEAA